jgi:hypothetical protein
MNTSASVASDSELDDVCLDGVKLVDDDPSTWVVPRTMTAHETVFGWWQHLHHNEAAWSTEKIGLVQTLIDSSSTSGGLSANTHAKVRSATERLIESGMTFDELERITGLPPATLLGGPGWQAWQMLSAGATVDEVAQVTTEDRRVVSRFAKMLRGAPVVRVYPKWMRAEAFELLDSGMSLSETATALTERHGRPVSRHTVHSWVRRNKPAKVQHVSTVG